MQQKCIIAIALCLFVPACLSPQGPGVITVADLARSDFRLPPAGQDVLVVRPFLDIYKDPKFREYLNHPRLLLSTREVGSSQKQGITGLPVGERWEFRLPELKSDKEYQAEFTLESGLDSRKVAELSAGMVKDAGFR